MAAAIGSAIVGVAALVRRGLKHPLGWAIAFNLVLAALENGDVIGNNYGSTRALMPVLVLGIVALFTVGHPLARRHVTRTDAHRHRRARRSGRPPSRTCRAARFRRSCPTGQYARSQDSRSRSSAVSLVAETATQPRTLIDRHVEQRATSLGRIEPSR